MKAYPKTLYVMREKDGKTDYFVPETEITAHAVVGETKRVGVYVLKETTDVKGVVLTNTVKSRKKK